MSDSWILNTASSTYAVSLALDDTVLILDYFGSPTCDPPRWIPPEFSPVPASYPDYAPVEYAALGTRTVHGSELIAEYPEGIRGSRFRYATHVFESSDSGDELAVCFADERGLKIWQHTRTKATHDVVERWAVISDTRNTGEPIRLARAFSGALNIQAPYGARLQYNAGVWMRDMQPQSIDLRMGTLRIGSRQGLTGHLFAPTMAVNLLGASGQPEPGAGTFGVALAWSGSWAMQAEGHPNGLLRISAGLDDEGTAVVMKPGREVELPHILALYVDGDEQDLSRAWHRYQRGSLSRSTSAEHRPIVYNSWEATEFDVREDHQLELAALAANVGAEVFVIDDGWFRGRIDGNTGLGDWTPDPIAFPSGLGTFADKIADLGLRFGLWVEPEAVSPASELYRLHPEWVYQRAGLDQPAVRKQFVLDLGNPEAYAWIEGTLRGLLAEYPISYLKWDMNIPIATPLPSNGEDAFEWSFQHTQGYYRLLQMIRDEFPHVTVEGCAGGGGRVDNKVLALTDIVWTSDATGPRDRLLIHDGFLRAYPASVMSAWVTDVCGSIDRARTSFEFRFVVAMAGVLGLGADLTQWDKETIAKAKALMTRYRELRPVLHQGAVYRHSHPTFPGYALEYNGGAEHGGRIVLLAYDGSRERTGPGALNEYNVKPPLRIRLASADSARKYKLQVDGSVHSGNVLRSAGLQVDWSLAQDADILVLDPV